MQYQINTPLKKKVIEKLSAGDMVYISGCIYTARDAAHKRMAEALEKGKELPIDVKGKIICLIDTDNERVEVDYQKSKSLYFDRLLNNQDGTILVDVNSNQTSPPTEIEDCLNPIIFWQTLLEFSDKYEDINKLLFAKEIQFIEKYSANFLDLTRTEKKTIKDFFDDNDGYNKLLFEF